jgi:hypothetical protein
MQLWGASSQDSGRTWAKNEQIFKSPDKSICACCHPTALFDETSRSFAALRFRFLGLGIF